MKKPEKKKWNTENNIHVEGYNQAIEEYEKYTKWEKEKSDCFREARDLYFKETQDLKQEIGKLKKQCCPYKHMGTGECIKQDAVNNLCEENDILQAKLDGLQKDKG